MGGGITWGEWIIDHDWRRVVHVKSNRGLRLSSQKRGYDDITLRFFITQSCFRERVQGLFKVRCKPCRYTRDMTLLTKDKKQTRIGSMPRQKGEL